MEDSRLTRHLIVTALLATIPLAAAAQNFTPCESLITSGLRNYRVDTSSSTYLDNVFDSYCDVSGSVNTTAAGGSLDAVVKAIPIKLTGSYSSSQQAMSSFCRNYSRQTTSTQSNYTYQDTIVEKAYESFNSCVRLLAQGVSITHDIVSLAASNFSFFPGLGKPITLRGVALSSNMTCKGLDQAGTLLTYGPSTALTVATPLGFNCTRSSRNDGSGGTIYDEATVQITTNYGNYNAFIPRDMVLPEQVASQIEARLSSLEGRLAAEADPPLLMCDLASNRSMAAGNVDNLRFSLDKCTIDTHHAEFREGKDFAFKAPRDGVYDFRLTLADGQDNGSNSFVNSRLETSDGRVFYLGNRQGVSPGWDPLWTGSAFVPLRANQVVRIFLTTRSTGFTMRQESTRLEVAFIRASNQ